MNLTTVREGHEINIKSLESYLLSSQFSNHFSLPFNEVKQFEGGQSNPTYFLRDKNNQRFVLRKKPNGKLLPSAHLVEREYLIMKVLKGKGVPVPNCILLCEDVSIIGTTFYMMDFCEGRIFRDPSLPDVEPHERHQIYLSMANTLAKLHSVKWDEIEDLKSFGKAGNFIERQIGRWSKQYSLSETHPIPSMNSLIKWLPANIPPPSRTGIVHGDYRIENLIFHPTEPKVIAILDWELSTIGYTIADLAYNCIVFHTTGEMANMRGFRENKPRGIPNEELYTNNYISYLNSYLSSSSNEERFNQKEFKFYLSFAMFRSCAILQGVLKRFLDGNAASAFADQAGKIASNLADIGWEIASSNDQFNIYPMSQKALITIKKVRRFMEEHVFPNESVFHSQIEPSPNQWNSYPSIIETLKEKAKSEGLWNLWQPKENGGEFTNIEYAAMAEIMGMSHIGPEVFNCAAPDTGNMEVLLKFASPFLQEKYLTPILNGSVRSCFAMTEPAVASSDARNISSTIERRGEKYIINGRKWYISGAGDPRCKVCIFMGKQIYPEGSKIDAYKQHSMIVIPMDAPGVQVLRGCDILGFDDAPHGHMEMLFTNVEVPLDHMIMAEGNGFLIAQGRLGPGRIHHCMRLVGLAQRALEAMCQRAISRIAFSKPLAAQGVVQASIANSKIDIEMCRLLTMKAAFTIDMQGSKGARDLIAMIKVAAPTMACNVIDRAIQVHGAFGLSQDSFLSHAYVGARTLRLADGPDEVHIATTAKLELRKYLQPKSSL